MDSSIAELKAELKKKEELLKGSAHRKISDTGGKSTFQKIHALTSKKKKKKDKNETVTRPPDKSDLNEQEAILLSQSRERMEEKTKLYEKMKAGQIDDPENELGETRFLVDFEKKLYDDAAYNESPISDKEKSSYTSSSPSSSSSIRKADKDHIENMHKKWEEDEKQVADGPVHYENVKFDEIRDLGTGYYAFSKDEETRKQQMEELQKLRTETLDKQTKKERLAQKRKAALQERLNKIKQRKLGIDLDKTETSDVSLVSVLSGSIPNTPVVEDGQTRQENTSSSSEMDSMLKDCRKQTQQQEREWDKGKVSVTSTATYKKQNFISKKTGQTSAQNFIEERRKEREDEFAPPNFFY